MFQQLKPLVAKSPIAMNVVSEGDLLRVTIAQKTSKRGSPLNISVLASAEDLGRDLPGEIEKAGSYTPAPAPIAEQVKAQVAAAPGAKPGKAAARARTAKKAKPATAWAAKNFWNGFTSLLKSHAPPSATRSAKWARPVIGAANATRWTRLWRGRRTRSSSTCTRKA